MGLSTRSDLRISRQHEARASGRSSSGRAAAVEPQARDGRRAVVDSRRPKSPDDGPSSTPADQNLPTTGRRRLPQTKISRRRAVVDSRRPKSPDDGQGINDHRLFARQLSRRASFLTLDATALAHEAYFQRVDETRIDWQSRGHFFALAARAMRGIVVGHARESPVHRTNCRRADARPWSPRILLGCTILEKFIPPLNDGAPGTRARARAPRLGPCHLAGPAAPAPPALAPSASSTAVSPLSPKSLALRRGPPAWLYR
jgi:hypothetical protein